MLYLLKYIRSKFFQNQCCCLYLAGILDTCLKKKKRNSIPQLTESRWICLSKSIHSLGTSSVPGLARALRRAWSPALQSPTLSLRLIPRVTSSEGILLPILSKVIHPTFRDSHLSYHSGLKICNKKH